MQSSRGALAAILLSLAGLVTCAYLGFLHIGLLRGELLGGAACGGAGSVFNCHAVTAGRFGTFLGLPLWVWGLMGYVTTFHLALLGRLFPDTAQCTLTVLTCLAVGFVTVDVILFVTMVTQIKYLCAFCLLTYAINLLLVWSGKAGVGQPWRAIVGQVGAALGALLPGSRRPVAWLLWAGVGLGVLGSVALHAATTYVSVGNPWAIKNQLVQFLEKEPRVTPDISGSPTVGPVNAHLQVVEFSDFFCPACQRASKLNPIILASHRQDVQFVFKSFPLDTACNEGISRTLHPGACRIAAAAACAHQQGKFWPFHDLVFERGHDYNPSRLETDIRKLGLNDEQFQQCLASGMGMEMVRRDTTEGRRLGVNSTPTYFVNGVRIPGMVTPAFFEQLADALSNDTKR